MAPKVAESGSRGVPHYGWLYHCSISNRDSSGTQLDKYGILAALRRRHKSQELLRSPALFLLSGPTLGSLHKKSANVSISALVTYLRACISPIPGYTATIDMNHCGDHFESTEHGKSSSSSRHFCPIQATCYSNDDHLYDQTRNILSCQPSTRHHWWCLPPPRRLERPLLHHLHLSGGYVQTMLFHVLPKMG